MDALQAGYSSPWRRARAILPHGQAMHSTEAAPGPVSQQLYHEQPCPLRISDERLGLLSYALIYRY